MKTIVEVAGRFFEIRKAWIRLRDGAEGRTWQGHRQMHELEQQMTALGWVLDVDLALMNAPKAPSPLGESGKVAVHALPAFSGYLIDIPRNTDGGWRTEDSAFFISGRQARELRSELFKATGRYKGDALTQASAAKSPRVVPSGQAERSPAEPFRSGATRRVLSDGTAVWSAETLPPGA